MLNDNKIGLTLTRNLESQNYIKYIDVIYYYIWGLVENRKLEIELIFSSLILVDGLIKALSTRTFKRY